MIIDIWMIRTSRKNGVRKQISYELVDKRKVLRERKTGYKVRYLCDNPKCRFPDKINITTTSSLYRSKWNSIERQICRSCRSIKMENEIKRSYIEYDRVKKSIESKEYYLLTDRKEYDESNNRSQLRLKIKCERGHIYRTSWNNWSRGKICRRCYDEDRERDSIVNKKGFDKYKYKVLKYTEKTYKRYMDKIDPERKRGRDFHLDHKFSIAEGYRNKISPKVMGSIHNIEVITCFENCSKNSKCSISKEKLLNEYYRKNR